MVKLIFKKTRVYTKYKMWLKFCKNNVCQKHYYKKYSNFASVFQ